MIQESLFESLDRPRDDSPAETDTFAPSSDPSEVVTMLIGATVHEVERELMLQTLARCDGNRTHAARVLGVSVRTMRNKIRQYSADGVDVPAHG
ncbi:helix-turn-helix domain-containing protein [Tardiphaga sp. 813_E8_N1_3]|uniref:helix-turn-helix domain-containing protein n=1 Tax=Tardiphaga sp. 813_E8_N1_3 TaxID=3240760 RepID=UPI003F2402C6